MLEEREDAGHSDSSGASGVRSPAAGAAGAGDGDAAQAMQDMLEAARLVSEATYAFEYRERAQRLEMPAGTEAAVASLLSPDPPSLTRRRFRKDADPETEEEARESLAQQRALLSKMARRQKLLPMSSKVIKNLVDNSLSTFFVFWRGKVLKHTDDLFHVSEKEREWYKDKGLPSQFARPPSGEIITRKYEGNLTRHDEDEDDGAVGRDSSGTSGRGALDHGAGRGGDEWDRSKSNTALKLPNAHESSPGECVRESDSGQYPPKIFPLSAQHPEPPSIGLKWEEVGLKRPTTGTEIRNEALAAALRQKAELTPKEAELTLTPQEFTECKVGTLSYDSYIKVTDKYWKPADPCAVCGQTKPRCTCAGCNSCGHKVEGSFAACACLRDDYNCRTSDDDDVLTPPESPNNADASALLCQTCGMPEERCSCLDCAGCGLKNQGSFATCTCPPLTGSVCAECRKSEEDCSCATCDGCRQKRAGSFAACTCPPESAACGEACPECGQAGEQCSCDKNKDNLDKCAECGLTAQACACPSKSSRQSARRGAASPRRKYLARGQGRSGKVRQWSTDHLPGFVYPMMVARYNPATDDVSIGLDSGAHCLDLWGEEFTKIQTQVTAPASVALFKRARGATVDSSESSPQRRGDRSGLHMDTVGSGMIVPKELWEKVQHVRQKHQISSSRLRSLIANTAKGTWVRQMRPGKAAALAAAQTAPLTGSRATLNLPFTPDIGGEEDADGGREHAGAAAGMEAAAGAAGGQGGERGGGEEDPAQQETVNGGDRGASQTNPTDFARGRRVPLLPVAKFVGPSRPEGLRPASAMAAGGGAAQTERSSVVYYAGPAQMWMTDRLRELEARDGYGSHTDTPTDSTGVDSLLFHVVA
jgi:hypothetical protein